MEPVDRRVHRPAIDVRDVADHDFSGIGGAARNNIATLNPKTGAEVTGFNPNTTGGPRRQVHAIAATDEEVLIGGSFTQVADQAQGQIARLTKTGGADPPSTPRYGINRGRHSRSPHPARTSMPEACSSR